MEDNIGELGWHLPGELILEILLRLPVKSLIRFKCVSKPWRSLISNTKFIALHDRKALEDKQVFLRRRRVIFTVARENPCYCLYSLDVDDFLTRSDHDHNGGLLKATELDFLVDKFSAKHRIETWVPNYNYTEVCGTYNLAMFTCNNLVVLFDRRCGFYLVNPATREMRQLPKTSWWTPKINQSSLNFESYDSYLYLNFRSCGFVCGFGFDHSTNEYKVVTGALVRSFTYMIQLGVVFSVYTLKTNSWRHIECLYPYSPFSFNGVFLNGAVHWLGLWSTKVGEAPLILCFLLAEEEVREIQLPLPLCQSHIYRPWAIKLGVFRDCLCVTFKAITHEFDMQMREGSIGLQSYTEFWVMKEYRVSESWTRMRVSMPYHRLSHFGFSTSSHDLMVCNLKTTRKRRNRKRKDGQRVRACDRSFVMYDFEEDTYWNILTHDRPDCVGTYVEGLFPLIDREQDASLREDESS